MDDYGTIFFSSHVFEADTVTSGMKPRQMSVIVLQNREDQNRMALPGEWIGMLVESNLQYHSSELVPRLSKISMPTTRCILTPDFQEFKIGSAISP